MKNRTFNYKWIPFAIAFGFMPACVSPILLGIFYGIIGVFFGVGFSLIISSVYKEVKHVAMRKKMRNNVTDIRKRFVNYFIISTCCYIIASFIDKTWLAWIVQLTDNDTIKSTAEWLVNHYHFTMSCLFVMIISIAVYIRNYISLQQLNEELDEELA